jgi:hypothetical protein
VQFFLSAQAYSVPTSNLWWGQHFRGFSKRNIPLEENAGLILISGAAQWALSALSLFVAGV